MKGFTIIELMILICIIGIILAVAVPACMDESTSTIDEREVLIEFCYDDCDARGASIGEMEACMQDCDYARTELLFREYGDRAGIYSLD